MFQVLKFIIIKLAHEIGFRLLSIFFYPISYMLRWKLRDTLYTLNKDFFEEVCFTDTRKVFKSKWTLIERIMIFLWFFLDDSTAKDDVTEVRANSYDLSNTWDSATESKGYPYKFIENTRFLRDYWWSNIRNSHVNYFSYFITGGWTDDVEILAGKYDKRIGQGWFQTKNTRGLMQSKRGFYIILVKHQNGRKYPYFMWSNRFLTIAIGKDAGSGRENFSIQRTNRA